MDFFTWGHLIILSLPGQSKDLMARLQAAVTWLMATCYDMLERVAWRSAIGLGMDEGCFKCLL